jgi:hypothetical protein
VRSPRSGPKLWCTRRAPVGTRSLSGFCKLRDFVGRMTGFRTSPNRTSDDNETRKEQEVADKLAQRRPVLLSEAQSAS